MPNALRQLFSVIVTVLAILGACFVLLIVFVPKSETESAKPSLAVLAPTITPTLIPTATMTQEAIAIVSATATVSARAHSAPVGRWCTNSDSRRVCASNLQYMYRNDGRRAGPSLRYIAFSVFVANTDTSSFSVSPTDVTLVMDGGGSHSYDAITYSYRNPQMDNVTIFPGDNAQGWIVFAVPTNTAPERVIYRGSIFEPSIVIDLTQPPEGN